ncbi:MAG TPA: beta-ketoacyl-[acyl-carrier-protein] synthase family protein [Lacunisphaera sp.]|nr:beta-ketoacyl-[acyl-carrier-protein] synthase family protein [Lacunisphaera sp.]
MRRRVKVTGIGPVTPAGVGRDAFYRGINEAVSRVHAITRFDPAAGQFMGAELEGFDVREYVPGENPRRLSRHTQLGLVAALLAIRDAGVTLEEIGRLSPAVITGTSIMDIDRMSRGVQIVAQKGPRYSMASAVYESSVVSVPGKISSYLNVPARMIAVQTSCCSGLDAIGQAADLVAEGQCNLAIAGGSEAPLSFHPLLEFNAADLSPTNENEVPRSCRPFDLWRSTGVLGEGAAMLILEPQESPRPAYAWITGYGYASDGNKLAGEGIADAARIALANASRRADEVDYICAWGPGHRAIDANESTALRQVFGERLTEIPATSIKGAIGTALAAAGAIEVASTALSMRFGQIPPTVNWETRDPQCPLNLSAQSRYLSPSIAMVNAHGLSGSNAVVVVEKSCPR